MRTAPAALVLCLALVLPAAAQARGGSYVVEGGTEAHRAQIRAALDASAFDWGVVPGTVTIHVVAGVRPAATPGHIWLDSALLEAGVFSWAVVQDEYAHQVDFLVLDEAQRRLLAGALGGRAWCHADQPGLPHADYGCERFTSTLVWAYWPAAGNVYRPRSARDESAAMEPARFRALLSGLIWTGETALRALRAAAV